jgi:hypothetical protein
MMQKVSKLIAMRTNEFMAKVLADDVCCHDTKHKHEQVREASLLFNEQQYAMKEWRYDIPTSGFAALTPMFSYV